jgi:hypothetical protein
MPFPVTLRGRVKLKRLSDQELSIEQLKVHLSSELIRMGMTIHHNENTKIKFKVPFVIWYLSVLFLATSSGEIELLEGDNEVSVKYSLNIRRLLLYSIFMLIIMFMLYSSFEAMVVGLIFLVMFLPISISMVTADFRRLIRRCAKDAAQGKRN